MSANNAKLKSSSHWDEEQIAAFLNECVIPVRLACVNGAGRPLVCSLWFMYDDDAIWCATKDSSDVVGFLKGSADVGFEVAPESMPYRGVRGQGKAQILPARGVPVLGRLMDRYLGTRESEFAQWLFAQATDEVAIRIDPDWFTAWDFSKRMSA